VLRLGARPRAAPEAELLEPLRERRSSEGRALLGADGQWSKAPSVRPGAVFRRQRPPPLDDSAPHRLLSVAHVPAKRHDRGRHALLPLWGENRRAGLRPRHCRGPRKRHPRPGPLGGVLPVALPGAAMGAAPGRGRDPSSRVTPSAPHLGKRQHGILRVGARGDWARMRRKPEGPDADSGAGASSSDRRDAKTGGTSGGGRRSQGELPAARPHSSSVRMKSEISVASP